MIHITKTGVLMSIVIALLAGCSAVNKAYEKSAEFVEQSTVDKEAVCIDAWYGFWKEPCESVKVEHVAKDMSPQIEALEQANQRLVSELADTKKQNETFRSRVSDLEEQLASLQSRAADSSKLTGRVSTAEADLSRAHARIADLERQLDVAHAAVRDKDRLASDLAAAQSQMAALQVAAGERDTCVTELHQVKQQVAALENRLGARDKEIAVLRGDLSAEMAKLKAAERGVIRALRPEIDKGNIAVYLNNDRLLINLAASYLFGTGEAQLSPGAVKALNHVGEILKEYPEYTIQVAGHTDDRPIRSILKKKFSTNQELSEARAANAAHALTDGGLREVSTAGYSDTQPTASNKTAAGRAKNRRVEVRVTRS